MSLLLLTSIFLPLAGAILLPARREWSRWIALITAVLTLTLAAVLVGFYPGGTAPFAATDYAWLGEADTPLDIRFSIALDGLSLWLYALTALLTVVSVLISWEAITQQASLFYRLLLILETGMLGVFTARDILLFYVFFEFTLIPLFFLIGIWGSEERRYAAIKFFLFTLAGSMLTFLGLLAIVLWDYYHPIGTPTAWKMTFSIPDLIAHYSSRPMDPTMQMWIFLALFVGFAVKVPLVPLHTWLPLAHVQAPAAGSVLLAGVLLKIGVYGFARFSIPMLPQAAAASIPWIVTLSVIGILYGALVALAQSDIKKLIAYSSVSHLGFCMAGLFAANRLGVEGGTLQLINHGLATGGLFALVGMIYERYHTRKIADFGGLARRLPVLSFFMALMMFSSIGLPGTGGFVGELLVLIGLFQRGWVEAASPDVLLRTLSVLAVLGVVLGAWYMLWLYQRVFFGPVKEPQTVEKELSHPPVQDLNLCEILALAPLAILIVWIGLYPRFFLDRISPTMNELTSAMRQVEYKMTTSP
jgi:NADH-quinone oxidoreductase subunit M